MSGASTKKRTLSGSEMHAYSRNRFEDRMLRSRVQNLSEQAQLSHDRHQREIITWRSFRKQSRRHSGFWHRSQGVDYGNDGDLALQQVMWPNAEGDVGGDRSLFTELARPQSEVVSRPHKPWAYAFSLESHNSVYAEALQLARGQEKRLFLRRSQSVTSPRPATARPAQAGTSDVTLRRSNTCAQLPLATDSEMSERSVKRPQTVSRNKESVKRPQTVSGSMESVRGPQTMSGSMESVRGPQTMSGSMESVRGPQTMSGSMESVRGPQTMSGSMESVRGPQTMSGSMESVRGPQTMSGSMESVRGPQTMSGSRDDTDRQGGAHRDGAAGGSPVSSHLSLVTGHLLAEQRDRQVTKHIHVAGCPHDPPETGNVSVEHTDTPWTKQGNEIARGADNFPHQTLGPRTLASKDTDSGAAKGAAETLTQTLTPPETGKLMAGNSRSAAMNSGASISNKTPGLGNLAAQDTDSRALRSGVETSNRAPDTGSLPAGDTDNRALSSGVETSDKTLDTGSLPAGNTDNRALSSGVETSDKTLDTGSMPDGDTDNRALSSGDETSNRASDTGSLPAGDTDAPPCSAEAGNFLETQHMPARASGTRPKPSRKLAKRPSMACNLAARGGKKVGISPLYGEQAITQDPRCVTHGGNSGVKKVIISPVPGEQTGSQKAVTHEVPMPARKQRTISTPRRRSGTDFPTAARISPRPHPARRAPDRGGQSATALGGLPALVEDRSEEVGTRDYPPLQGQAQQSSGCVPGDGTSSGDSMASISRHNGSYSQQTAVGPIAAHDGVRKDRVSVGRRASVALSITATSPAHSGARRDQGAAAAHGVTRHATVPAVSLRAEPLQKGLNVDSRRQSVSPHAEPEKNGLNVNSRRQSVSPHAEPEKNGLNVDSQRHSVSPRAEPKKYGLNVDSQQHSVSPRAEPEKNGLNVDSRRQSVSPRAEPEKNGLNVDSRRQSVSPRAEPKKNGLNVDGRRQSVSPHARNASITNDSISRRRAVLPDGSGRPMSGSGHPHTKSTVTGLSPSPLSCDSDGVQNEACVSHSEAVGHMIKKPSSAQPAVSVPCASRGQTPSLNLSSLEDTVTGGQQSRVPSASRGQTPSREPGALWRLNTDTGAEYGPDTLPTDTVPQRPQTSMDSPGLHSHGEGSHVLLDSTSCCSGDSDYTQFRGFPIRHYVRPHERYKADPFLSNRRQRILLRLAIENPIFLQGSRSDLKAEVIFPKTARRKVLQELVAKNSAPVRRTDKGVVSPELRAKIEQFFKTLEPFCPKPHYTVE